MHFRIMGRLTEAEEGSAVDFIWHRRCREMNNTYDIVK